MMIPRIAHFVWFGSNVPAWAMTNILTFHRHNPDWCVRLWTSLPDELPVSLRDRIDESGDLGQKARCMRLSDVLSYWLLYEYGGVYLDTDVLTLRSFEPLRGSSPFLGRTCSGFVNVAVMGAAPRHPLFGELLRRVDNDPAGQSSVLQYGPSLIGSVVQANDFGATVFPPSAFHPLAGEDNGKRFWNSSDEDRKAMLAAVGAADAYCVHVWGLGRNFKKFEDK